jgi:NAD(P) transhydrogenase subunit alpha
MPIRVAVPHETTPGERRVALIPGVAEQLTKQGLQVQIQAGAGCAAFYRDRDYTTAEIVEDRSALLAEADIVLTVSPLTADDVALLREGTTVIDKAWTHCPPRPRSPVTRRR